MAKTERILAGTSARAERARVTAKLSTLEELFWRVDRVLLRLAPWLVAGSLAYIVAHMLAAVLRGAF